MKLEVRWHDGYLERFDDIVKWRSGGATLWIKHADIILPEGVVIPGKQEWIPLISVRRFSFDGENP